MQLGVNWTDHKGLPVVASLVKNGQAQVFEILIDNFLHFSIEQFQEVVGNTPVAFHIMSSQFLEAPRDELRSMAKRLRELIKELRPLYVSDHLAKFSHRSRQLPRILEWDYSPSGLNQAVSRLNDWQEALGCQVLVENFPSVFETGRDQPEFMTRLLEKTGAGILFDISNAVVAEKNCALKIESWESLFEKKTALHFHAGGYRTTDSAPQIFLDTHDEELSSETLAQISKYFLPHKSGATLVVERDFNIEYGSWQRDLAKVRAL